MEEGRCETRVGSDGLVLLEVSRASVSQSGLKTGGNVTTGGARDIIMEIESRVRTGYIGPFYHKIIVLVY
jgi:hypothetical protein